MKNFNQVVSEKDLIHILKNNNFVVVIYSKPDCKPCVTIKKHIKEYSSQKFPYIFFAYIDCSNYKELSNVVNDINSFPTCMMFHSAKLIFNGLFNGPLGLDNIITDAISAIKSIEQVNGKKSKNKSKEKNKKQKSKNNENNHANNYYPSDKNYEKNNSKSKKTTYPSKSRDTDSEKSLPKYKVRGTSGKAEESFDKSPKNKKKKDSDSESVDLPKSLFKKKSKKDTDDSSSKKKKKSKKDNSSEESSEKNKKKKKKSKDSSESEQSSNDSSDSDDSDASPREIYKRKKGNPVMGNAGFINPAMMGYGMNQPFQGMNPQQYQQYQQQQQYLAMMQARQNNAYINSQRAQMMNQGGQYGYPQQQQIGQTQQHKPKKNKKQRY